MQNGHKENQNSSSTWAFRTDDLKMDKIQNVGAGGIILWALLTVFIVFFVIDLLWNPFLSNFIVWLILFHGF